MPDPTSSFSHLLSGSRNGVSSHLMGKAEGLGKLADLAQGAEVFVQAADGLLDALAVGGLRGSCSQKSHKGSKGTLIRHGELSQQTFARSAAFFASLKGFIFVRKCGGYKIQ